MVSSDPMDGMLRWGVLGTARTARKRTLPAILRAAQRIVAIAGRNRDRRVEFSKMFGINTCLDWDQADRILQDPHIDAVYIPLPNSLHAEWVVRSLDAGKHVLCEKPIAMCPAEVEEIAAAAVRSGTVVEENFSYPLAPGYRYLEQLRSSEHISTPDSITIRHLFVATGEHRGRYDRALGGGSFLDLGCYAVDFVHRLLNEPIHVVSVRSLPPSLEQRYWGSGPEYPVDVRSEVLCSTLSGVRLSIITSFVDEVQQSVEMEMTNGESIQLLQAFRIDNAASEIVRHLPDGEVSRRTFTAFDADAEMLKAFSQQVSTAVQIDDLRICRWKHTAEVLAKAQALILAQVDGR